jgi:hypothetical protein
MNGWTEHDELQYAEAGALETDWDFEDINLLRNENTRSCNNEPLLPDKVVEKVTHATLTHDEKSQQKSPHV